MDDRQRRLIDAIEACRPGRDDLKRAEQGEFAELSELARELKSSNELRQRFEATQRADAKVQKAFVNAPIPAGLADRIAAHIAEHGCTDNSKQAADGEASESKTAETTVERADAKGNSIWRRRRWLIRSAVSAAVLLVAAFFLWPGKPLTETQVVKRAPKWEKLTRTAWRDYGAPMDRPWSSMLAYTPDKVADVDLEVDGLAAVYQYVRPLRDKLGSIHLYVLKRNSEGLPTAPPTTPQFDSLGLKIGVWANDGVVYTLVVRSKRDAYRRLVGTSKLRPV